MHCPSCDAENSAEHKFCGQCGTPLPLTCADCAFENPVNARFCGGCGKPLHAAPAPVRNTPPPAGRGAERRHLTVMFCDLVGSTDLSVKFDPEDLSEIIKSFQACCEAVIRRHHGYVARYMGDGLLNYFGYPTASEYDAEYAMRAGLEIIAAVSRLDPGHGIKLQTRVGIASGNVVVGDVIGEGQGSREETVVGETPNLAARLQSLAPPNSVVTSSRTRRLVGGLFEYEDLGQHSLKGFDVPVPAFLVKGESLVESRFEAARDDSKSHNIFGREAEAQRLREGWQRAVERRGQLIMICGEAGIGKSQLLEDFRASLNGDDVEVLRMYGSPHAKSTPLHPIIAQLLRAAGIKLYEPPEQQWHKLVLYCEERGVGDAERPLLASLLGIPAPAGYELPPMPPPEQKFRTIQLLTGMVSRLSSHKPTIVIMEDLHWLDASSIELLDQVIQTARDRAILVLATFRPDFTPDWLNIPHAEQIDIGRLGEDAARALIVQTASGKRMPEEMCAHILRKAEGVPLYVEELTKAILESPLLQERDNEYILLGEFQPKAVPESLQDSLMARLDRMAPVKEIAQIGAVLGREFQLAVLQSVTAQPEAVVLDALRQLVDAEIIVQLKGGQDTSYLFKHALLQDSAYNALLKSRRRQLHAQVATSLKNYFRSHIEERPELLAHHYTEAEMWEEGFDAWHAASQLSLRKFAHREICDNLHRGLALCDNLGDRASRRHLEFEMRSLLGSALMVIKGPGDEEVGTAYENAVIFARQHADLENTFPVEFGLCRYHWASGELGKAVDMASALLAGSDPAADPGRYMASNVLLGISLWHQGRDEQALECLEKVCDCYRPERDAPLFFTYLMDFGVFGNFYRSLALQSLGRSEESIAAAQGALQLARELNNPHEIGFGLLANFIGATMRADYAAAIEFADECIEFSRAQGFPEFVALAQVCGGTAKIKNGCGDTAIEDIASSVQNWERTGFTSWLPWLYGLLADAAITRGDRPRAESALASARDYMDRQNERQAAAMLDGLASALA